MSNILIADSGATSSSWCLINGGIVINSFITNGISPIYQSVEEISIEIERVVYPHLSNIDINIDAIRFYCADRKSVV